MNTAENIFLPTPITSDELEKYKVAALREYASAKSSAMRSAANAYLVWYHGESEYALSPMREWLDGEIEKANEHIKQHNDRVDLQKERAKLFLEGKLNAPLSDEEKVELLKMNDRKPRDWAKEKQVRIEARNGASSSTRIVKFVFGFNKPSDASHVSRYSKALEYIEQHKEKLRGELSAETIVALLNDAGGFEASVEAMRGTQSVAGNDDVRAATLKKIKEAVSTLETGATIELEAKHGNDGYVFLVGRTTDTGVIVCGELAVNDNEADELLLKVSADVIGKPEPTIEFVSRFVSVGQLVHAGRDSHLIDTAATGKKFKVARAYSMLSNGTSTQVIVSGRYAETSLVVHAYPKQNVSIGALEQGQAVMLEASPAADLATCFADTARCHLMTIEAVQGDRTEPIRWCSTIDMGAETNRSEYVWKSMYGLPHLPLTVRGYEPENTIKLTLDQLRTVYDAELTKWSNAKADDKEAKKPITVEFDGSSLVIGNDAFGKHKLSLNGERGAHVALTLRPRDIVDLFKKLISLGVQNCSFSGDNNGMLEASWEDAVGNYHVYIPAIEARGTLSKACLGYIKPTA